MLKSIFTAVLLGLTITATQVALAHGGAKPKHGGIVQASSDLSFELVSSPEGVLLYVEDHGKPVSPVGMSGKLTVLKGSEKSEAEFVPAGDRLLAKGITLQSGAKVVAAISTSGKKTVTVRFAVR
jgi:hypothetical protein